MPTGVAAGFAGHYDIAATDTEIFGKAGNLDGFSAAFAAFKSDEKPAPGG